MIPRRQVRIRIESSFGSDKAVQAADAELYPKGEHFYIRYEEPLTELGRTVTLLKLEESQLRIIRQGDVRSEQTFVPGQKRVGFYETAQGRLELETQTHAISARISGGLGTVSWSYDLFMAGEHAGLYRIKLLIEQREG